MGVIQSPPAMPGEEESFNYKHIDKKILQCYNERGLPTEIKKTKEMSKWTLMVYHMVGRSLEYDSAAGNGPL